MSVVVDMSSGHNFFSGRTRDVSAGGLFIETNVGLPIGAEVALDLEVVGHRFRANAEVAWVLVGDDGETAGVGVRFVRPSPLLLNTIAAFMARRGPIPFEMDAPSDPPPKKTPRSIP